MTTSTTATGSDAYLASLAGILADIEATERHVTVAQVAQLRVLARAGQLAETQSAGAAARVRAHDMALRAIAAEVGGVLRATDRTVQRRIDEARTIVEDYPAALSAWETGRIARGHVLVIVETGAVVPPDLRGEFEAAAIARCERDTPNRVRSELEILAQRIHPRPLTERHAAAAASRCVRLVPGRDGMSDLVATLPTVIAAGIHDRLTQQARAVIDSRVAIASGGRGAIGSAFDIGDDGARNGEDAADASEDGDDRDGAPTAAELAATDRRSTDQVRADILADLLLAGSPALDPTGTGDGVGPLGAIRGHVQVVVSATTLCRDDDGPADLIGSSPVDAATARELAGGAHIWERLFTHPLTGTVLAVDSYRVPLAMRRYLQARDQHCRFPGCRVAAIRCELDHTHDHALGGPTDHRNLEHLCQRHHSMKQFTAWRVRQLPGGVLHWTSPTGRSYREDAPSPAVTFVPAASFAGDPAPF